MNIIKPVTFIKDKIVASDDLNSVFVTPYNLKMISDLNRSNMLDMLKGSSMISDNSYRRWATEYAMKEKKIIDSVISDYIEMNVLDLYVTSINWLHSNYMMKFELPTMVLSGGTKMLPPFSFDLDSLLSGPAFNYNDLCIAAQLSVDQYMNQAISIVTQLYNNWITDDIVQINDTGEIDEAYRDCYRMVFKAEDSDDVPDSDKYLFVLTTYREIVASELEKIRQGMTLISQSVVGMILDSYGFLSNIRRRDYRTENLLEDKPQYQLPLVGEESNNE